MAILSSFPGLEVAVQSFNQDLPEYVDEGEWTYREFGHLSAAKRVSKFVECQADAEFRIRIILKHPYQIDCPSLTFRVDIDGHGCAQSTCLAGYFTKSSNMYMKIIDSRLDWVSATKVSSRTLKFGSIKKVDDTDSSRIRQDAKLVAGIGEIVVSVFRTTSQDAPSSRNVFAPPQYQPPTEVSEVAEKAVKGKAISHGVAYGEQKIVRRAWKEMINIDGPENPIAVFVFKYRSRDDLKAELIIARSPSPERATPPPNPRSCKSGHVPESREARLASLKQEIAKIKAEEEDSPQGRKRRLDANISQGGRAYKTSHGRNGSLVIDLTDD